MLNYNAAANSDAAFSAPASTVLITECYNDQASILTPDEVPPPVASANFSPAGDGLNILNARDDGTHGVTQYETGLMGGYTTVPIPALFHNLVGRHSEGSIFVMADYHTKFFRRSAVSPGANASSNSDNENMSTKQAAGTGNGQFAVTFSTN